MLVVLVDDAGPIRPELISTSHLYQNYTSSRHWQQLGFTQLSTEIFFFFLPDILLGPSKSAPGWWRRGWGKRDGWGILEGRREPPCGPEEMELLWELATPGVSEGPLLPAPGGPMVAPTWFLWYSVGEAGGQKKAKIWDFCFFMNHVSSVCVCVFVNIPLRKLRWLSSIWLIRRVQTSHTPGWVEWRTKDSTVPLVNREVTVNLHGSFSTFSSRPKQLTCVVAKTYLLLLTFTCTRIHKLNIKHLMI